MQAIINGEMYEVEPAVKVILDRVMTENAELKRENKRLENQQGVVEFLRDYGIKDISTLKYILDQYQKFIVEITHGKLSCLTYSAETILSVASDIYNEDLEKAIAEIDELKAENARLEEGYQKSIGVIAATDCVECKKDAELVKHGELWVSCSERMPETLTETLDGRYSDCCLVFAEETEWIGMAYYRTNNSESWWEFADAQNKPKIDWAEITHWMPLPNCPNCGAKMDNGKDFDFNNSLLRSWE